MLSSDINYSLSRVGDQAYFAIDFSNAKGVDASYFVSSLATICLRLSSWLVAQPLLLQRVDFVFSEPPFGAELELIFAAEINYGQASSRLVFDAAQLQLPLRQTQATLATFLQAAPASLLTRYRRDNSHAAKVRRVIERWVTEGGSLDEIHFKQVAEQLQLPAHTLRRRLSREGHSFQTVLDNYRRSLAMRWVSGSERSISAISNELGFSEPAAFTRAFKRWTGVAPRRFRQSSLDA